MALQQTRDLVRKYGQQLINNTISDSELISLLSQGVFKKFPTQGYVDPNNVSDDNFSQANGTNDFVLTIAPQMTPENLHKLTARMIEHSPQGSKNTFMRGSTLEKAFLAYEVHAYPDNAEQQFTLDRMKAEYKTNIDKNNLKKVILKPIIEFFNKPLYVDDVFTIDDFNEFRSYLSGMENAENLDLKDAVNNLLDESNKLYKNNPKLVNEITHVLEDTSKLIDKKISVENYQSKAEKIKGHTDLGLKILGGLMLIVAKIVAGLGKVVFAKRANNTSQRMEVSAISMMKHGKRGGVVQSVEQVAKAESETKDKPHKSKHGPN